MIMEREGVRCERTDASNAEALAHGAQRDALGHRGRVHIDSSAGGLVHVRAPPSAVLLPAACLLSLSVSCMPCVLSLRCAGGLRMSVMYSPNPAALL